MPETKNRPLKIFLCHAHEDKATVRELYRQLCAEGWMDVWLDEEKLLPGQKWDLEIEKAVEAADVVLVCLSTHSVDKEGYVQKDLNSLSIPLFTATHVSLDGLRVAYLLERGDLIDLHIYDVGTGDDQLAMSYIKEEFGFIGWNPDSVHFVIWMNDFQRQFREDRPLVTAVGEPPDFLSSKPMRNGSLQWIDATRFLYVTNSDELLLESWDDTNHNRVITKIGFVDPEIGLVDPNTPFYDFTDSAVP
jgi:hypothetical protein